MLFNLLLSRIRTLLSFSFLFLVMLNNFLLLLLENTKVKLALAISAGAPIAFAKEITDSPPLVVDKTIKVL